MMVHLELMNHLLFLTFVFKGVQARRETLIVLNEGDELLLNCPTHEKFNIIFPRNNSDSSVTTSEHELIPRMTSGQIVQWTFRRKKTVFGDTGQYIFAHIANQTIHDYQHAKTFKYFYVYVRSMKNLFVAKKYYNLIMSPANSSIVLPCRPTAPELVVVLINSKTNENVNISEKVRFDPKIGFTVKLTDESGSMSYICRTRRGILSAQRSYTVIVTGSYAGRARISAKSIDHLVIGQTLKLNCTVVLLSAAAKDHVTWMVPRDSTAIMRKNRRKYKDANDIVTAKLTVKNLTFNDMGLYTCDSDASFLEKDESVFINVYNDMEIKSSRTPDDIVESFKLKLECISWYGHDLRTIEWLDKNNESIVNHFDLDERIEVFHSDKRGGTTDESFLIKRAYLHINNISKADVGVYSCLVKKLDNSTKSVSYNVTSIHKPLAPYIQRTNMNGSQVVLYTASNNVSQLLICNIKGMPRPKTTWYKNDLPLNKSFIQSSPDLVHVLFSNAESGGKYKCVGTNSLGRVEAFTEFIIIDKDLSHLWIIMLTCFILILTMLIAFFAVKFHHDTKRTSALDEIGLSPFQQGNVKTLHLCLAHEQKELHYDPENWEFRRKDLIFGNQLSSGGFGVILKGEARRIIKNEEISTVVMKKVLQKSEHIHREATAKEFKFHLHIHKHINIVRILGICTDKVIKGELVIIMEYCKYGSLLDYMLRNKSEFVDQIDPATGKIDPIVDVSRLRHGETENPDEKVDYSNATTKSIGATYPQPGWRTNYSVDPQNEKSEKFFSQDLNYWAYQISRAMDYLHQKKIIHSDLAARNVLLTEQKVVKICDIGIAKTMCSDYNYRKEYSETFPIKWMAVESIKNNNFSFQSDLWSYAVTLWEIYSFAEEPYPGIPNDQIYDKLVSGYRLEKPKYAVKEVYDIMLACWNEDPHLRPSVAEIVKKLKEQLSVSKTVPSISYNDNVASEDSEIETETQV